VSDRKLKGIKLATQGECTPSGRQKPDDMSTLLYIRENCKLVDSDKIPSPLTERKPAGGDGASAPIPIDWRWWADVSARWDAAPDWAESPEHGEEVQS
jgi:hypothetical protein